MIKGIILSTCIFLLLLNCESRHISLHHHSPLPAADVNRLTQDIIRNKIVANRLLFSNQAFANTLINDLYQTDDNKRTLKEIDRHSASELLALFGIRGASVCGLDRSWVIRGPQLRCLRQIFKAVKANPNI